MRHLILIAAAFPVVTASMALSNWARSDISHPSYRNDVQVLGAERPFAGADPADKESKPQLTKDCEAAAQRWKNQLDTTFNVITKTPFVVIGDLPADELERHLKNVVLPTTAAIQADYTEQSIDEPVVLMLFATEASYRHHSRQLFGQRNASVYGYYKPSSRTVAINLESGLGTLVHELTHAVFDFDFSGMPLWFNEGIASLHEQATFIEMGTSDADGHRIVGRINWRYPILRDAITANRLNSIEQLLTDNEGFHGSRESVNYAHARYLCMYLQQKKQLVPLYKSLRDRGNKNIEDAAVLQELFPGQPWSEINDDFREWAIALKDRSPNSRIKTQDQ